MRAAAKSKASRRGTLFLVVGPSGVGKDAVIAHCSKRLFGHSAVVFPRRAITRATDDGSEHNDAISEQAFAEAVSAGRFALFWRAHGLSYGIPVSVVDDLAAGRDVVVNVSRSVVAEARLRFRPLAVVSVEAPSEIVAGRLKQRGRESDDAISDRLARAGTFRLEGDDVVRLDNSGALETAGDALAQLIKTRGGIR